MKKKEKSYIIIFDKHKNFKEIRILSESSDPFVVNPKSVGDSVYIYTQKEFAKLIESAMRHLTSPVGEADDNDIFANMGQQVILPDGRIGYIKEFKDGSNKYINMGDSVHTSDDVTVTGSNTVKKCCAYGMNDNKKYLKYYKAPTGTCSDSSSAMPTEAASSDATKAIKKTPEEYRSDGKTTCTLTGGVDINPKIVM